jgi:hypothetical protein
MGMYEKHAPVIHRDGLTTSELLLVQELDSLANSAAGEFLRKESGSIVNGTPADTGNGVTMETPTGSVDGSNTTFTVSAEPQWVVSDGITYFANLGYTYSGGTIEMTVPPSQYIRAFI